MVRELCLSDPSRANSIPRAARREIRRNPALRRRPATQSHPCTVLLAPRPSPEYAARRGSWGLDRDRPRDLQNRQTLSAPRTTLGFAIDRPLRAMCAVHGEASAMRRQTFRPRCLRAGAEGNPTTVSMTRPSRPREDRRSIRANRSAIRVKSRSISSAKG